MARRLDVWLNDISLRDVDPRIIISDVHEKAAQIKTTFGDIPLDDGQRLLDLRRTTKTINIEIRLRELYDIGARQLILDAVNRWACDGWLKLSSHPGQRIYVHATSWPTMDNARSYTDAYTIGLTAAGSPFWEDEAAAGWSGTGTSGSGSLSNVGSVAAMPAVTVESSSALSSLTVAVGDTSIALSDMSVAASTPVRLYHDERGFLHITAGTASLLSYRSAASSDELIAQPGVNGVSFTASTACKVTISVRGRYR